ncbi:histidinol-phosphate aminotransferase [Candidatus Magnetoovum chiemensis]|nr:histidinol-phosphate aminotransferase [Candidatus Magnetoovum chiemensis]
MINAPDHIKTLKPYIPGKPIEELERQLGIKNSIKLASNENPLGPSPLAVKAMTEHLSRINRYPDGSGFYLKNAIAENLNIKNEEIILGNGSNELIDITVRTFVTSANNCIMADPSFPIFYISTEKANAMPIKTALKEQKHDLISMADKINEKTKIVFIANPNNPTGTIVTKDEFDAFMNKINDNALVVSDEAYNEYVSDKNYPDTLKYIKEGRGNILILRTFSKIHGLAGLRIGYGIGHKHIIEQMKNVVEPFNTSSLAQIAAIEALKDKDHIRKTIELNEKGKDYLYSEFDKLNIDYTKTQANFIYVNLNRDAKEIYEKLLHKGIIVRPMQRNTLRITIGKEEENKEFIHKLKEVL